MKIHDLLAQVVQTQFAHVLTTQEIQGLMLQYYPYLKRGSVLPAEHTSKQTTRACRSCQKQPLFEKIGHGLYKVLFQPTDGLIEYSIHDKLTKVLTAYYGEILTIPQIHLLVKQSFPDTHLPSVIPTDHLKGGACRECSHFPLLNKHLNAGIIVFVPPL